MSLIKERNPPVLKMDRSLESIWFVDLKINIIKMPAKYGVKSFIKEGKIFLTTVKSVILKKRLSHEIRQNRFQTFYKKPKKLYGSDEAK